MSDKIMAAISSGFIARMQAWAHGRDVPLVSSSWPIEGALVGIGSGSKFHTHRIPPLLYSVHDTEMAIATLPVRYRGAVRQFWLYEGISLREHGRRRGVEHRTFEAWVMKGHTLLVVEFAIRSGNWQRKAAAARKLNNHLT